MLQSYNSTSQFTSMEDVALTSVSLGVLNVMINFLEKHTSFTSLSRIPSADNTSPKSSGNVSIWTSCPLFMAVVHMKMLPHHIHLLMSEISDPPNIWQIIYLSSTKTTVFTMSTLHGKTHMSVAGEIPASYLARFASCYTRESNPNYHRHL